MKKNKKYVLALLILAFSVLIFALSGNDGKHVINAFLRGEPGEGIKEYELVAMVEETEIDNIDIHIAERKWEFKDCSEVSQEFENILLKSIFNNSDKEIEVNDNLFFPRKLSGYPFEIFYHIDCPDKLSTDGKILVAESFAAKLIIRYSYESYSGEIARNLRIIPNDKVRAEILKKKILDSINEADRQKNQELVLPTDIDGKDIYFYTHGEKRNPMYLLLGLFAGIGCLLGDRIDEKRNEQKRKEEILKEYPILLQKMSLYLAAGMTIRNIWELIYIEGIEKKGKNHPLYIEMGIAVNEIQSGVSEALAYKRFGERTGTGELVRFTALLSQNLKRGSSKLKDLLDEETAKAFVVKKQRAISEGEKAGTRLLIPMMLLLVDVLVMIMVPAFWSI